MVFKILPFYPLTSQTKFNGLSGAGINTFAAASTIRRYPVFRKSFLIYSQAGADPETGLALIAFFFIYTHPVGIKAAKKRLPGPEGTDKAAEDALLGEERQEDYK